ncbi:MAG: hypothetical protein AAB935_01225 [Patescibacteria group bacterium]
MRIVILVALAFFLTVTFPVLAEEDAARPILQEQSSELPQQPLPPTPPQEDAPRPVPQERPQQPSLQPSPEQESRPEQFEDEMGNNEPAELVDPRELQDTLRQIRDLRKEISRVLKRAKKLSGGANEVAQLNSFLDTVGQFEQKLKSPDVSRDALQEFRDAQLWEEFNGLRLRIEFPIEAQNVKKDLKRLEKIVGAKNFSVTGLDINAVREKINEIKNAIAQAETSFAAGDWESVQENMQVIYEGSNPGEMMGVLSQLRDIEKGLRGIKSEEVRTEIQDILSEVFMAANGGEFREANVMLRDIQGELRRILNVVKKKPVLNEDLRSRIRKLEQKIQEKAQSQDGTRGEKTPSGPQSILWPYKSYRSASLIEAIMRFLGK